jgi:hypothetical protein
VHAYCLMKNHFHLVIETPQPNLVNGSVNDIVMFSRVVCCLTPDSCFK